MILTWIAACCDHDGPGPGEASMPHHALADPGVSESESLRARLYSGILMMESDQVMTENRLEISSALRLESGTLQPSLE